MDRSRLFFQTHHAIRALWVFIFLLAFGAGALGVGCARRANPIPTPEANADLFEDATESLGVRFLHDCGDPTDYSMFRIMGSGCAIFDADGDQLPDLLLLQNGGERSNSKNKLYRQESNGHFVDASEGSGLDFPGHNMGVAVGDYDGDGRPDILVTQYRGIRFFRNLGNCKFLDVTAESGIENPYWGASTSFVDIDRDGRLDIVIVNYLQYDSRIQCNDASGIRDFCGPAHFSNSGCPAQLFRNLKPAAGGPVRFENVTQRSGVGRVSSAGLGVHCSDFTDDGWPDLFVANDGKPNHLWVNQRNGTFQEEAVSRGVAFTGDGKTAANMGIAVGDVDGDGLADLFVTHLTSEMNTLWKQGPPGRFLDRTLATSAVATRWRGTGFGTAMADLDLDGWPDLVIVNGRVHRGEDPAAGLPDFWKRFGERNQVLRNVGGKFVDASDSNLSLCLKPNVARGLAVGDINGDGKPDLLINSIAGPAKILLNRAPDCHWLAVRPYRSAGQLAYGAEVRLFAGGRTQLRVLQPSESYLSSSNPECLFGLGDLNEYEEIRVRWPDGTAQIFPGGAANRRIDLKQSASK